MPYRLSSTCRTYFIIDSTRSVLFTSLHAVTLLIVSDIHNHSTNCRLVLPDFATVLYHIA